MQVYVKLVNHLGSWSQVGDLPAYPMREFMLHMRKNDCKSFIQIEKMTYESMGYAKSFAMKCFVFV